MTHRDLENRLRRAQRAEADQVDPGALLERVQSIPERAGPQRRHWWSGFRLGAKRGADGGGDRSQGRQNHMILAASTLSIAILGLGGVVALSGAIGTAPEGSAPGAVLPVAEPDAFTGSIRPGPCSDEATVETRDGFVIESGFMCQPFLDMSDERMSGSVTWSQNVYRYPDLGIALTRSGIIIENENGAWRQMPVLEADLPGATPLGASSEATLWVFVGEGGYEGMSAVAVAKPAAGGRTFDGYIFGSDLPPVPDVLRPQ